MRKSIYMHVITVIIIPVIEFKNISGVLTNYTNCRTVLNTISVSLKSKLLKKVSTTVNFFLNLSISSSEF